MALTNVSKPTTTLTNITKVSFAELWSTILTTWDSEPRTWDATGSLFVNTFSPQYQFLLTEDGGLLLLEDNSFLLENNSSQFTNQVKPT